MNLLIRILFSVVASLVTLFLLFYAMSMAVKPFLQPDDADEIEAPLDYELADMPEVALPSASTTAVSLDTTGVRLTPGDENPAPAPIRGRWLAGPRTNFFQIDGAGRWLRLTGHTEDLWAGYRSHLEAAGVAANGSGSDDDAEEETASLCLEVELSGHLGAQETDQAISSITVEQVQRVGIVDVDAADCLTP
jgi:hypothetical protein